MMRFTARPVASIARLPGTPAPPRMFTDQLTGKEVTQAEVDSLGGIQTFLDSNAPKQERNLQDRRYGQVAPPQQFEYDGPGPGAGIGYQPRPMMQTMGPESIERINRKNQEQYMPVLPGQVFQKATYGTPGLQGIPQMGTALRSAGPDGGMGGISNRFNPPQQRGGMFNQQQPNQQGMQQMMQFMQQMMQMFSMMGGQNRGGGFGGGFGGQQQYQQPQRYQPQPRQQYQPLPSLMPPVQQQYGQQMQPQQPSPFAQSIRPRY